MSISAKFMQLVANTAMAKELFEEAKENLTVAVTKMQAGLSVEIANPSLDADDRTMLVEAAGHFRDLLQVLHEDDRQMPKALS